MQGDCWLPLITTVVVIQLKSICATVLEPSLSVLTKTDSSAPVEDAFYENVFANLTHDLVSIEFRSSDGMHVTEVTDFRKELRLWRVIILGEEERGDPPTESLCFAAKFKAENDLLTPASIARLRQRNPTSIKMAEEERTPEHLTYGVAMSPELATQAVTVAAELLCKDALFGVLLGDSDFRSLTTTPDSNGDDDQRGSEVRQLRTLSLNSCATFGSGASKRPCKCLLKLCIPWLPCGWKLCKNKNNMETDNDSLASSYKCGIKTCRTCYTMEFEVSEKRYCMWEE